ncbi:GntR family transcriptional regulator [Rhodococcus koreensis]
MSETLETKVKAVDRTAELIFAHVRDGIAEGEYEPGMKLGEAQIASRLGVSRTPVREALLRLESAGLVEVIRNRGAFVLSWTRRDYEEIFGLRIMLESHGAKLAAEVMTEEDVEVLEELADKMDRVLASGAPGYKLECLRLNTEFHQHLVAGGGNARLNEIVEQLTHLPLLYRALSVQSADELARSFSQHHDMIAAIRLRNGEWAEALMRAHILHGREVMRRAYPDDSASTPLNALRTAVSDTTN